MIEDGGLAVRPLATALTSVSTHRGDKSVTLNLGAIGLYNSLATVDFPAACHWSLVLYCLSSPQLGVCRQQQFELGSCRTWMTRLARYPGDTHVSSGLPVRQQAGLDPFFK